MLLLEVGEERKRWQSMRESAAAESIAGLLLLQRALTEQGVSTEGMILRRDSHQRPFLQGETERIDFNVSHANGLVVCALETATGNSRPRIGIDTEKRGAMTGRAMDRIVARWFSEEERVKYKKAPTEETFLRIWTGKEALVKQTGEGMSGLAKADTENLPQGLRLTAYPLETWTVTLCHQRGTEPPEGIVLLEALG